MTDGQSEVSRVTKENAEQVRQAEDGGVKLTAAPRATPELMKLDWTNLEPAELAEIDWAIAGVIGLQSHVWHMVSIKSPIYSVLITSREWDEIRGIEHETCEGSVACILFRPSTDLSVAFVVARMTGVFKLETSNTIRLWIEETEEGVGVSFWKNQTEVIAGGEGATLALAICAAILKLKKERGDD